MKTEPKIGDIIYQDNRYHGLSELTIERFTKTTAVLNNGTKLRLPLSESFNSAIGSSGYHAAMYYTYTKELQERCKREILDKKAIRFFQKTKNITDMPIEILEQIYALIAALKA